MPGQVQRIEISRRGADAMIGEHGFQVFAVQHIEPGEGAAAGAAFLHRWLVALPPGIGQGEGVEIRPAMGEQEGGQRAGNPAAPIHHSAESVEDQGFDGGHSAASFWAQRLSKSQTSGKPINSQIRPKP